MSSPDAQYKTPYAVLSGRRTKSFFSLLSDFKPEDSNKIITDLAKRIELHEKHRNMQTKYSTTMTAKGMRIEGAEMRSEDGVVNGHIYYIPPNSLIGGDMTLMAEIIAVFRFNSGDKSLLPEYQGLSAILEKM